MAKHYFSISNCSRVLAGDTWPIPELAVAARDVFQPRGTSDTDVSALAPYGEESIVLEGLLDQFPGRRPAARAFAMATRVFVVRDVRAVAE